MKSALIIFVRNPLPGKVKTRLAQSIGEAAALNIYLKLLHHTHSITDEIVLDKFLFYDEQITRKDIWENDHYKKYLQKGDTLGERMSNAFSFIFLKEYRQVVIIGSDCYELNSKIIQEAFEKLNTHNVVIGPAKDGGYYLLGAHSFYPDLFKDIDWSTTRVLEQTEKNKSIETFQNLP